jgi:hypothetical protein
MRVIPQCRFLPFASTERIPRSRVPDSFFVDLGAEITVASTTEPALNIRTLDNQNLADHSQHLRRQRMRFEQVAEPHNRTFVQQTHHRVGQPDNLAVCRHVVQRFFMAVSDTPNRCCKKCFYDDVAIGKGERPVLLLG